MTETSTSSQSSAPLPYNVGNGAVISSDARWNQVNSTHMLQNTKPADWNALPPQSVATVPLPTNNVFTSSNNVNIISNQVVYKQPSYVYMNIQRSTVPNGYATYNPGRGINPPVINGSNPQPTQNGQIIGDQAWPNQSPFGRIVSQPPGWANSKPSCGAKKPKRIRTAFTTKQTMALEQDFARTRYLDPSRRLELAEALQLNQRTVKIWFQHRRMKEKKDKIESMEDSEDTNTSESSQYTIQSLPPSAIVQNSIQSQPHSMPVQNSVRNMYENFLTREECQAEYQQGHLSYQSSHIDTQELPGDIASPSVPSEIIANNCDYSWIRSLQY